MAYRRVYSAETPAVAIPIDPVAMVAALARFSAQKYDDFKNFQAECSSATSRIGRLPLELAHMISTHLHGPDSNPYPDLRHLEDWPPSFKNMSGYEFSVKFIKCASRECNHGHTKQPHDPDRMLPGQAQKRKFCAHDWEEGRRIRCEGCNEHAFMEDWFKKYIEDEIQWYLDVDHFTDKEWVARTKKLYGKDPYLKAQKRRLEFEEATGVRVIFSRESPRGGLPHYYSPKYGPSSPKVYAWLATPLLEDNVLTFTRSTRYMYHESDCAPHYTDKVLTHRRREKLCQAFAVLQMFLPGREIKFEQPVLTAFADHWNMSSEPQMVGGRTKQTARKTPALAPRNWVPVNPPRSLFSFSRDFS